MAFRHSYTKFLKEIEEQLSQLASEGRFNSRILTDHMVAMGFSSSLYFDLGNDLSVDKDFLYLSSYSTNNELNEEIDGYKIPLTDSAISVDHTRIKDDITIVDPSENHLCSEDALKLSRILKIDGEVRIHLRISIEDGLFSTLMCTLPKEHYSMDSELENFFLLLISLIRNYIRLAVNTSVAKKKEILEHELNSKLKKNTLDESALIKECLSLVREIIRGSVTSCFEYDWYRNSLVKTQEVFSPDVKNKNNWFAEEYCPGEYLTGLAWERSEYRLILNFEDFRKSKKLQIEENSMQYHSEIIGSIKSVLYCKFGSSNRQFLIRVFNREGSDPAFLVWNRILLDTICAEITGIIDEGIVSARLKHLQKLSSITLRSDLKSQDAISFAKTALKSEYVSDFSYLSIDRKTSMLYYAHSTNEAEGNYEYLGDDDKSIKSIESLLSVKELVVMTVASYKKYQWSTVMLEHETPRIAVIPVSSESRLSALAIWLPSKIDKAKLPNTIPQSHIKFLYSFAATINACLEVEASNHLANSALNLVARIGHEIQWPSNAVVQYVTKSLIDFELELHKYSMIDHRNLQENVFSSLTSQMEAVRIKLEEKCDDITRITTLAKDVAQNPGGDIPITLNLKPMNLRDILKDATEHVNDSVSIYNASGTKQLFNFKFNDAVARLVFSNGDSTLIMSAFVNVFTNAVKYSMPPGNGEKITVEVICMPQSEQNIIQVKNFGFSIRPVEFESIFLPFERGEHRDELNSRRGMGLGLYMARKIFQAHRGSIFVRGSERFFSDVNRNKDEGWITVMEMRLPVINESGVIHVE